MNMTGFIELHQGERHDKANGGPLETPNGQFKHFGQTLPRELRRSTGGCHASLLGEDRSAARQRAVIAGSWLPHSCLRLLIYDLGEGEVSSEGDGDCSGSPFFWAWPQEVRRTPPNRLLPGNFELPLLFGDS